MNGDSYLFGALYHTRGGFSRIRAFVRALPFDAASLPYDHAAVTTAVRNARIALAVGDEALTAARAKDLAIDEDLAKVEQVLADPTIVEQLNNRFEMGPILKQRFREAAHILDSHGASVEDAAVFVVDEFPPPYQEKRWAVMAADRGDQAVHGIAPGLYFLRNFLRPFYSEYLVFHEIIHVVLGVKDPQLLGRGLEEGIAEVLGAVDISRRVLGKELTSNLFIYNRLNDDYDMFWEQYLDATRAAGLLYSCYGLEGLYSILNGGRKLLKDIEFKLLSGKSREIDLPSGDILSEDIELIQYLFQIYPRATVVSPLARHIARYAQAGLTVREVMAMANVGLDDGLAALDELAQDTTLLGLRTDRSVISWSDSVMYSKANAIRYRL